MVGLQVSSYVSVCSDLSLFHRSRPSRFVGTFFKGLNYRFWMWTVLNAEVLASISIIIANHDNLYLFDHWYFSSTKRDAIRKSLEKWVDRQHWAGNWWQKRVLQTNQEQIPGPRRVRHRLRGLEEVQRRRERQIRGSCYQIVQKIIKMEKRGGLG